MTVIHNGKKITCEKCGSEDISAWSRIVGYFSNFNSWGKGKKEELKARRKGNYKI